MPNVRKRPWNIRSAILLLAPMVMACTNGKAATPSGPPPPAPVKIVTLQPATIRDTTEYIATMKSRRSTTVQPQVDGQVAKIFVRSGDAVEAGAPLLQIDPARQAASVSSARANYDAQVARLQLAKQELERIQSLIAKDAATPRDLDNAKANVVSAQAQVDALGAAIRENQVQLEYYRVVAPTKGVVGDIPVRVGDRVTSATILTTVNDAGGLEAYVSIPVERSAQVNAGTEVELIDAAGQTLDTGKVYFISQQVSTDTQALLVKAEVANKDGLLHAEQIVRARVVWGSHPGILVPALAVVRMNGQGFVYVAQEGAQGGPLVAKMRPVRLGDLSNGSYVVLSGLEAGEKIVATGVQKLRDGVPIAPAPEGAPGGSSARAGK